MGDAEIGERGRAHARQDVLHVLLHVADRIRIRLTRRRTSSVRPASMSCCTVVASTRRQEEGTNLVVEVARDLAALLLLHGCELLL